MTDDQHAAPGASGRELATTDSGLEATVGGSSFDASLAAERVAERTVMRSIVRSVAIALPISIALFIGLIALAVGDQLEWWVILGVGSLLGVVCAMLFGVLGGVTIAAHAFEEVDKGAAAHA